MAKKLGKLFTLAVTAGTAAAAAYYYLQNKKAAVQEAPEEEDDFEKDPEPIIPIKIIDPKKIEKILEKHSI